MSADERLPTLDLAAIGNSVLSALVDRNGRIVILLCGGDKSTQAADIVRAKELAACV